MMIRPQANIEITTRTKKSDAASVPRLFWMIMGRGYSAFVTAARLAIPSTVTIRKSVPTPPLSRTDRTTALGTVRLASTVSSERFAADSKPTRV